MGQKTAGPGHIYRNNMKKARLTYLLEQYARKAITPDELKELAEQVKQEENAPLFTDVIAEGMMRFEDADFDRTPYRGISERVVEIDRSFGDSDEHRPSPVKSILRSLPSIVRWRWAAAVVVLLGVGMYALFFNNKNNLHSTSDGQSVADVAPGREGAILTLADGSQVVLDSAQNGVLALQGGATAKIVNGTLVYEGTGKEIVYNTMSTPKGRQFHLTLPDGTGVWLNSASYIRYPTVFAGNERRVEVGGEAYFEVTKNSEMPFRLNINHKAEVEVLGTSFNVNAYENEESINTTLLEGIVRIKSGLSEKSDLGKTLKPGQQAQISNGATAGQSAANIQVVNQANIGKVMAWKNGLFNFEGATLKEVMRQVERWYDIEVVYEKDVPAREFEGEMTRGITLQQLQATLEEFGVHTRLAGRTLTVLP